MDVMKTLALKSALLIAKIEADKLKDTDDGGTCNFDTPTLKLPSEFSNWMLDVAFQHTGLSYERVSKETIHILGAVEGQGFRRTAMAEAFRNKLCELGYVSYMYYQMD